MSTLLRHLALLPVVMLLCACRGPVSEPAAPATAHQETGNPNVRFGFPAPARSEPDDRDAYLIDRPQYALSYNAKTKTPNWVCWRLEAEDIGNEPRGQFEQDPKLPKGFSRVVSQVYNGSGFDRGHMCPAKDRSRTPQDVKGVFYMTNIVPQSPASNQKAWERLEDYCRRLAKEGHVLQIACGPAGVGGEGRNGPADTIGTGRLKVTVPHQLWKVIMVLPHAEAEPRRNTRVIAVIMPNDQSVDYDWPKYRTSTQAVEDLTGLHFFPNLPAELRDELVKSVDDVHVHVTPPRQRHDGQPRRPNTHENRRRNRHGE